MARVLAVYRVLPEEVDIDLGRLLERLREAVKGVSQDVEIRDHREEPVAFGLKALIVSLDMPEMKEGLLEEVEKAIESTEGVGSVESLYVTRV